MTDNPNVQAVKKVYNLFKSGDIRALVASLPEDIVFHTAAPEVIPTAGTFHGRQGVALFFKKLVEGEETLAFEPRMYLVEGDTVAVLGHYQARIRANARMIDMDWVQLFTLRDGNIVRWEQFYDTAAVADAFRLEAAVSR